MGLAELALQMHIDGIDASIERPLHGRETSMQLVLTMLHDRARAAYKEYGDPE
jgi:hypothetical protein